MKRISLNRSLLLLSGVVALLTSCNMNEASDQPNNRRRYTERVERVEKTDYERGDRAADRVGDRYTNRFDNCSKCKPCNECRKDCDKNARSYEECDDSCKECPKKCDSCKSCDEGYYNN